MRTRLWPQPVRRMLCGLAALVATGAAGSLCGGDWPQWHGDAMGGAATAEILPATLKLQWSRTLPAPRPAWPESQPWMRYDAGYWSIATAGLLIVPSMNSDHVTAYDLDSGAERWRFFADGPIRLAPAAADGRVFFGSDDGYLYCLAAGDGKLLWRVRGGPSERRLLGNDRLTSTWPIRSGPLVDGGTVYFTAGLWPFMGIFVHAVDAQSGRSVWINSGEGANFLIQPHKSPAFSGFSPQGYMAVTADELLICGGRTQPACYDRQTGRQRFFDFSPREYNGWRAPVGTWEVATAGKYYFHSGRLFAAGDGQPLAETPATVCDGQMLYGVDGDTLLAQALDLEKIEPPAPPPEAAADKSAKPAPASGKKPTSDKADKAATSKAVTKAAAPPAKKSTAATTADKTAATPATAAGAKKVDEESKVSKANPPRYQLKTAWRAPLPPGTLRKLFLKAGPRYYLAGPGSVVAVEVAPNADQTATARVVWTGNFSGTPWQILAADGKLVVTTAGGQICVYGVRPQRPTTYPAEVSPGAAPRDSTAGAKLARQLIAQEPGLEGYALLVGLDRPEVVAGLVRATRCRWIGVDVDPARVQQVREHLTKVGLYGWQFSCLAGDVETLGLPPYLFNLALVSDRGAADAAQRLKDFVPPLYRALRPYGGVALIAAVAPDAIRAALPPEQPVKVSACDLVAGTRLVRHGPPPGAGQWTHQYADAGNTVISQDTLVRAPLGLLWYGGPSNDDVLPRHGHGPSPQVLDGRLFIEGPNMLRAMDIYTGRLLWQRDFEKLGQYYDNTKHQPGAAEIGGNYVTIGQRLYLIRGPEITGLDTATGDVKERFAVTRDPNPRRPVMPPVETSASTKTDSQADAKPGKTSPTAKSTAAIARPEKPKPLGPDCWTSLLAWDDYLIATAGHALYEPASPRLIVLNRRTGKVLWEREAQYSFRHNAIAVGAGRVYCLDCVSPVIAKQWKRRGEDGPTDHAYAPQLLALDVKTGRVAWETRQDVFGTFLSYSTEHDILLQSGSAARDRSLDEADRGMVAYRGRDGQVLWQDLERTVMGPCLLNGNTLLTQNKAYALLTGQPKDYRDPLTGEPLEWRLVRNYGCNTIIGCRNLLTFRSAAAGFYDLERDGGTGNMGGFKAGCTSNLIPAGGVLSAPDYTRTCICRYQLQSSLAMIHDPDAEMWTFNPYVWNGKPIRRLGINFGAPGDRMADDGTLWLEWPALGGPSPEAPLSVDPGEVEYFRHHSSRMAAPPGAHRLAWVAASGVKNVREVTVSVTRQPEPVARPYTVRLHFAEVDGLQPGQRVFRISLQGKSMGEPLDIVREAGPMTALVKEFPHVSIADKLTIAFEPPPGHEAHGPLLCGLELVAE